MNIILATNNQHKINEFKSMLHNIEAGVYAYGELVSILEIQEVGLSFKENAILKAQAVYQAICAQINKSATLQTPIAIIAEDSGLCIPAIGGEPGIYSARYAHYKHFSKTSQNSTDLLNLECLIQQIKSLGSTPAYFTAHIALMYIESDTLPYSVWHFEGKLQGSVISEARGKYGFGYDPIFIPEDSNPLAKTLAEFTPSAKNTISHRYKALSNCIDRLDKLSRI